MEIGAARLGTSVLLSEAMGDGLVVAVDLPESQDGTPAAYEEQAQAKLGDRFRLIRGASSSYDTIGKVREALGGRKIDVLFIDAEHTEAAALADYEAYRPYLSEYALTAFHDICYHQLWPMWNRLRGERPPDRSVEIIRAVRQRDCGIGVLLGR